MRTYKQLVDEQDDVLTEGKKRKKLEQRRKLVRQFERFLDEHDNVGAVVVHAVLEAK